MEHHGLNKQQLSAVNHTKGAVLVLAGAGSGKTRVLTHRVAKLIEEGVGPYNILALTFTNKAANEMKERIFGLVGSQANNIWIGTFHSVCLKVLMMNIEKIGFKPGFVIYDADDSLALIKRILKDSRYDTKEVNPRTVKYEISAAKNDGYTADDYLTQFNDFDPDEYIHEATAFVFEAYEKNLKDNNALDFDDLLIKTTQLFRQDKDTLSYYQDRFKYILVDEYQDTNEVQYRLVKMLAAGHQNLFVVGDDDQSIYGWRGANIENIYNFEKDFPGAAVYKLEQNYRSHQKILDLSNAVICHNAGRKAKELFSDTTAGEKPKLFVFEDEYAESRGIATLCVNLQEQGEILNDIAIIYRTNAQSRLIEQALVEASIPSKNLSGRSFYERKEIKDMLAYLYMLVNPDADLYLARIINTPKRKIGDTSVAKIRAYAAGGGLSMYDALPFAGEVLSGATAKAVLDFYAMMEDFRLKKDSLSLNDLMEMVFETSGLHALYLQAPTMAEGQGRIENVEELVKNAAEREARGETLEDFLYNISLITNMERETSDEAVSLMTMHSAKGLEYRNVMIAGVVDGVLPHTFSSGTKAGIEEERRLLYVGITRAKERLFMTAFVSRATRQNGFFQQTLSSISSFIKEVDERLYDKQETGAVRRMQTEVGLGSQSSPFSGFEKPSFSSGASMNAPNKHTEIDFSLGDDVRHPKFGQGVVTDISGTGDQTVLTVEFETHGPKKIFAAIAPIEKI